MSRKVAIGGSTLEAELWVIAARSILAVFSVLVPFLYGMMEDSL